MYMFRLNQTRLASRITVWVATGGYQQVDVILLGAFRSVHATEFSS